jgi:hypothetical protein
MKILTNPLYPGQVIEESDQVRIDHMTTHGGWVATDPPPEKPVPKPTRKVWPTNAHFWAEFTPGEQVAIAARQEGPVRALLISFSVWPAEMWSDDERVVKAMQALVAVGAITPGRAEEILKPSA